MQRSPFSPAPFLLFTLSFLFLVVACAAPSTEVSLTVTLAPTLTQTPAPFATSTPTTRPTHRPTITLAPTRTPAPLTVTATQKPVNWLVDWSIKEVPPEGIGSFYWKDKTNLTIYIEGDDYSLQIRDGMLSEITKNPPEPTITPAFPNLSSFSPKRNFAVECAENQLTLYKMPERTVISVSEGNVIWCPLLRWKSDETAVTFISRDGKVYLWKTNGTDPKEIGTGISYGVASWSPDESKLLTLNYVLDSPDELMLTILYPDGRPMKETGIKIFSGNNWEPTYVGWDSERVVSNGVFSAGYSSVTYYDLRTGEEISGNFVSRSWDGHPEPQYPIMSPDLRWIVLDESEYYNDFLHEYVLLNFENAQTYTVSNEINTVLDFVAWSQDSSQLFVTVRRAKPEITTYNLQLGFQAFDPKTYQFTSIIPNTRYATINADQQFVFALTEDFEQKSTYAGIYTLDGVAVTLSQLVSSDLHYLNPGEGLPIPAAWSNDGTLIIFSDVWGDLWLADTSGAVTQLADNLGFDPAYPRQPRFSWSPDDSHLLITFNDRAWVLSLP